MPDDRTNEPEMQPDTKLYEYMDDDWDDRLIRALDKKIADREAKPQQKSGPRPDISPGSSGG